MTLAATACKTEAREAERAEVARVMQAIRVLREAPNDEKRPPLRALAQTPCSTEAACALRDVCSDAYGVHLAAIDGLSTARHALDGDAGTAEDAAELVQQSEALLGKARQKLELCIRREGELTRTLDP